MAAPVANPGPGRSPGGRSGGGWRAFLGLSVSDFAWEFLRRNPDYHVDYGRTVGDQDVLDVRWGLRFAVDPARAADRAAVFWRPEIAPGLVVPLQTAADGAGRVLPVPSEAGAIRRAEDGVHMRLASGLQLLLRDRADLNGPLVVLLAFDEDFGLRVRAVEALERASSGRAAPRSRLTSAQRLRLAQALGALDGALRNDSYRDITRLLFGEAAAERSDYRTSSVRDVTIRLVRAGRALMAGGYLKLLRAGL
jgi:hypothetical protein